MIINGININKCEHHKKCILPDNIGCKIDDILCCDKPNCEYKKLARKTAECEKKSWEIGNLGYKIKNQRREINERLKQIEKLKEKEQECERYKQAIEEILELADDNKHTIQYKGICQSILEIINNAKDINVPTKKESE